MEDKQEEKYQNYVKDWDADRVLQSEEKAQKKARFLGSLGPDMFNLMALLKDYTTGKYRNISLSTIGLVAATLAYFISPLDFVPDLIPFLGYGDDIAFLSATLFKIRTELEPYKEWKLNQK